MAMTHDLIVAAMVANAANPTQSQEDAAKALADAIIATIESATITYTTGLANSGGAVTGVFGNTIS